MKGKVRFKASLENDYIDLQVTLSMMFSHILKRTNYLTNGIFFTLAAKDRQEIVSLLIYDLSLLNGKLEINLSK